MFWGVCCSFLMNLSEWLCFIRHCRRIWSKPTVWQRCTGSSVSLWRQNCHKSERKGTWAGKYLRYHCCTGACVYKIIIHLYVFYGNLQFCCHYYFGLNKTFVCRSVQTKWPSVFSWWLSVTRRWRRRGPWRWRASRRTWNNSGKNSKM